MMPGAVHFAYRLVDDHRGQRLVGGFYKHGAPSELPERTDRGVRFWVRATTSLRFSDRERHGNRDPRGKSRAACGWRFDNAVKYAKIFAVGVPGEKPGWRVTAPQKTLNEVASLCSLTI